MAISMQKQTDEIAVIGAGIVGICAATYLAEAGFRVAIFDRTGVCEETSSGNAAALAFSDVLPLAQKGIMRNLPRWLADPLGPLAIPPAYLPRLAPWLWRFWRASSSRHYDTGIAAQVSLMQLAEAEWMQLFDRSGTRHMVREDGSLELYESEAEFSSSLPGWAERTKYGIDFTHLDRDGLEALQPGLAASFIKATFVPAWKTVADPKLLGKALFERIQKCDQVRYETASVSNVVALEKGAQLQFADGRTARFKKAVVCAGAWSHFLAKPLGDTIPLETERGYHVTLPSDAFDVKRQLIFSGHGFVITPLDTGLRVAGTVELGGLERAPNYARAKAILEKSKRFLPGLKPENGREWMGYRPSLPDSLPVIGTSKATSDIVYAFGHGHLGLTQAAATGRVVQDLVLGRTSAISLSPYSPQRF